MKVESKRRMGLVRSIDVEFGRSRTALRSCSRIPKMDGCASGPWLDLRRLSVKPAKDERMFNVSGMKAIKLAPKIIVQIPRMSGIHGDLTISADAIDGDTISPAMAATMNRKKALALLQSVNNLQVSLIHN
jgi:hypothetical protein